LLDLLRSLGTEATDDPSMLSLHEHEI